MASRPAAWLCAAALCAVFAPASPAEELSPADLRKVEAWIRGLDAREFPKREEATAGLRAFGARALPLLRDASRDGSEETRARARLLIVVLEAGLDTAVDPAGWATLKGDMGRTNARGLAPAAGPAILHSRLLARGRGDGVPGPDSPLACAEGVVVAVEGDRVSVFEAEDLAPRWSAAVGAPIRSSPVVARGLVHLGTSRGLVALRLADGKEEWSVSASYGVGAAPLVAGNTLYACLADESVVALDPATGARRWEHRCGAGRAAPVLAGGRVVTGLGTAEVVALDAATGTPAWSLPVNGAVTFAPAAVGPSVVVGDGGRRLRCVDAESGRVLWTRVMKGRFLGDGPAVSPRAIVFTLDSLEVEAYDPSTGRRLWNRWFGTFHLSSPALAGNVVLVGSRTRLVALDAGTGDDAWQADLDANVACPLVADGRVYVLAGRKVAALR